MTTHLSTAAPPYAPRLWIANDSTGTGCLFIEYPVQGTAPFIQSYPLHPDGLGMALSGMIAAWQKANPTPRYVQLEASHPVVNSKAKARPGTEDQRERAAAILRKLGITPKARSDA